MIGVIALNHPDSDKAGIVKFLTTNPKIKNSLGMIDFDNKDIDASEMFSPAELLSSFTSLHSDPPRQSMQAIQSKHIIPTILENKPLVTTGMHKAIASLIGNDFVFKAKEDGKVIDVNDELGIMVVKYDNSKRYDVINLNVHEAKNSGGG